MSPPPTDRQVRKQLVLAKIGAQRAGLRTELARVAEAARLPNLIRSAGWGRAGLSLLGSPGMGSPGGGLALALALLRRYRVAATLVGAAAPLLRRGGVRRVARLARIGGLLAAAWFGWRLARPRAKRG